MVAPIGVMFKLGGNVYRVVGQNGSTALAENQSTHVVWGGCCWHNSSGMQVGCGLDCIKVKISNEDGRRIERLCKAVGSLNQYARTD